MERSTLTRGVALAALCTALALAGCDKTQTSSAAPLQALPLTTADTPAAAPAPTGAALPAAPAAKVVRVSDPRDRYAYLERAYAASRAYADAPPDYAVDYQGERPWIWRGGDGSERVVERTPAGLRYFYYKPGADQPYLVQDPDGYAYGYGDGQLAAVYGPGGAVLPDYEAERRAEMAGRYLAWASALRAASLNGQRQAVEQARWDERRAQISAEQSAWAADQSRQQAWAAYHDAHQAELDAHWANERAQREAEAARYAQASPPPGPPPMAPPPPVPRQVAGDDPRDFGPGSAPGRPFGGPGDRGRDDRGPDGHGRDAGASQPPRPGPGGYAQIEQAQQQAAAQQQEAAEHRAEQRQAAATAAAQRQATLHQAQADRAAEERMAAQAHASQVQAARSAQASERAAAQAEAANARDRAAALRDAEQGAHEIRPQHPPAPTAGRLPNSDGYGGPVHVPPSHPQAPHEPEHGGPNHGAPEHGGPGQGGGPPHGEGDHGERHHPPGAQP
jgi:hypothetical protein